MLSIGETVEEVNDSGFEGKVPTIRCQLMADDSMLQVRLPWLQQIHCGAFPQLSATGICVSHRCWKPELQRSPHTTQPTASRRHCAAQVHGGGLRHIRADRRVNEWRAPGRRTITKAATNERQAVIVLSGGELLYFELDAAGQLQVRPRVQPGARLCV